ncbi:glycosyl transferase [Sulfitobacter sp. SK012]|uniref:glycosyltransferase n=1 Tax=Sulfitobacter sp. SK012 TaxID=1389005 RepID=UPI000E0A80E3|nr:glycosyltransferase [Sulfitobacter sp. SK012]AXI45920.1 glycosyl transferase [Sulfitobacter sp. SK012]
MSIAAIVIGRNEGTRLIACLDALRGAVEMVVYVDSGSNDGSIGAAQARGANVVALDMAQPFTAARARNAGLDEVPQDISLVQFLDGDCVIQEGWLAEARSFLEENRDVAVVCGRRREIHPQSSIYNALIDLEWDTPVGEAKACGGDALMRMDALRQVGGYRNDLIAGEEPELCLRLRAAGWSIWRLEVEMTAHDAQITQFGQWWKRSKRAGHAFAEGAWLHGSPPERHWVVETRRSLIWGAALPAMILLLVFFVGPVSWLFLLVYPLQMLRLSKERGLVWGVFNVLGKFPEALGALSYYWREVTGGRTRLIEYK